MSINPSVIMGSIITEYFINKYSNISYEKLVVTTRPDIANKNNFIFFSFNEKILKELLDIVNKVTDEMPELYQSNLYEGISLVKNKGLEFKLNKKHCIKLMMHFKLLGY
jgi:hypothetical protein